MSRLPSLRPRQVVKVLKKAGFTEAGQSGSHLHLEHPDGRETIVPMHTKDLKRGTLLGIINRAGYTADEFNELL